MPATRALLTALLTVVAGACAAAPALAAAEIVVPGGGFAEVAMDPASGRSVGISSDIAPGGRPGRMTMRLYATTLDAAGRPRGASRMFAPIWSPDLMGPHLVSVATDVRRGRHLVAYTASKPGMGNSPCEPLPTPSSPEAAGMQAVLFSQQRPCDVADHEIFVRVLDRAGRAVGAERQVSSVGPPASGLYRSGAPSVAYDARSDSYLVVFNALVTGDQMASAVLSQRLRPDGSPLGAPRALALQPEPVTARPQASLVADPRGGHLLVYTSGQPNHQALYARRLTSDGALSGPTSVLSGKGIGSFELDIDRGRRRVLVAYTRGGGVDDDIRARLLNMGGRPVGDIVDLPYRIGGGGVYVASAVASGRWLYGFARHSKELEQQAFVQSADSRGRPQGTARALSPPAGYRAGAPC